MLILYITYIDFGEASSGSGVRPVKMYDAFRAAGHEVRLLSGAQGSAKTRGTRLAAVTETVQWLDDHRPDLCYIESPVYPILWSADYRLIRKIHRMGIPIGYFYRDFYLRFPDLYPGRTDLKGRLKDRYLAYMQKKTDRLLDCADIVYFPSLAATKLFSYRDMRALPPAGEIREDVTRRQENNTCIYVGGMGGHYGGENLLRAFELLNDGDERFPLLLICRQAEWAALPPERKTGSWLEVHHTYGSGLPPLYQRAALAVLPVEKTAYTDLAVNIKLFEYMSYGLPIASTDVTAVSRLVEDNGMGRVSGDSPEAIAENIRAMLADPKAMDRWSRNAVRSLESSHLWIHRARQVVRELTEKRKR